MKTTHAFEIPSKENNTDVEVPLSRDSELPAHSKAKSVTINLPYFFSGIFFGIILVKSEVISWFRIQEMFRLQSFHMYGVLGSAIVVGIVSIWIIKKFDIKTIHGETIRLQPYNFSKGQIFGGLLFGVGWALTGACPGPLFAQIGTGVTVVIITLLCAIAGTWTYGLIRGRLPH